MSILIYAEYNELSQELKDTSKAALKAARILQKTLNDTAPIDIILFSKAGISLKAENFSGIRKIFHASGPDYEKQLTHLMAPLLIKLSAAYKYILAPSSVHGKNILPIISASFNVSAISDVVSITDQLNFQRFIYTGNALASVKALSEKIFLTIHPTAFTGSIDFLPTTPIIETIEVIEHERIKKSKFCHEQTNSQKNVDLQSAKIVIAGGRALQSSDNFQNILGPLAEKLEAALGASRAAVDAGFAPNDWQIGQTGKSVSPRLYLAIGISGAQQHIAGMKDSEIIIAINTDSEAPIMQIADYAIIDDLFTIVPLLTQKL